MKILERYGKIREISEGVIGFMGLSLGKPLFSDKEVMQRYASFMSDHFSYSYFCIADTPKIHNIVAIDGVTEEEAMLRVSRAGESARKFLEKITAHYDNMSIVSWDEMSDHNYYSNLKILGQAYENHGNFRRDCDEYVLGFLNLPSNIKKIKARPVGLEMVLEQAHHYLMEELAMLLSFPARFEEAVCEIYPGRNEPQEKLQQGMYEFCSKLVFNKNRLFMEVYDE
jgi:tRNA-dependent cyclodipeptide synthase